MVSKLKERQRRCSTGLCSLRTREVENWDVLDWRQQPRRPCARMRIFKKLRVLNALVCVAQPEPLVCDTSSSRLPSWQVQEIIRPL